MKNLILVGLVVGTFSIAANAEELSVCGYHRRLEDWSHRFDVERGDLPAGSYVLTAPNGVQAMVVNRMPPDAGYCLLVNHDSANPGTLTYITFQGPYGN